MLRPRHLSPRARAAAIPFALVALSLAAIALALALPPRGDAATTVSVSYLQGEQMVKVTRPGEGLDAALAALLAGPSAAERKRQIRTYILAGTPVRSAIVEGDIATVDFGERLVAGRKSDALRARLAQVVGTVTAVPGIRRVRVRVEGGTPLGLFPGIDASRALTVAALATPAGRPTKPPPTPQTGPTETTRDLQQRLADLGFMAASGVDGRPGPETTAGVIAFQKWRGLSRDGVAGPRTLAALKSQRRPAPIRRGSGRRAEVLLDRQVVLAIEGNRVVRTLQTSTGAAATPTPPGNYTVYGKFERWWSVPFQDWLPWSVAFVGGIAFHEYPVVPVTPASHGCVRLFSKDARWLYGFLSVGRPVTVIASSR